MIPNIDTFKAQDKRGKRIEGIGHAIFLVCYVLFAIGGRGDAWDTISTPVTLVMFAVPVTLFYVFAYWIFPKLLKRQRWLMFVVIGTGLVAVSILTFEAAFALSEVVSSSIEDISIANRPRLIYYNFCVVSLLASFGFWFVRDWFKTTQALSRLEAERLGLELSFLKTQFNPHFVFNTLNTIYAIALEEKGQQTADAVTKLSGLMRYNLRQAQNTRISLSDEIEYLHQYLQLQQLRLTPNNSMSIDLSDAESSSLQIAPAILLTFVENAFKHGISSSHQTELVVQAQLQSNTLTFKVRNSVLPQNPTPLSEGIGLPNAIKRLHLEYPKRHDLRIDSNQTSHSVTLQLQLDS